MVQLAKARLKDYVVIILVVKISYLNDKNKLETC